MLTEQTVDRLRTLRLGVRPERGTSGVATERTPSGDGAER